MAPLRWTVSTPLFWFLKVFLKTQVPVKQEECTPETPNILDLLPGVTVHSFETFWFLESLQLGNFYVLTMPASRTEIERAKQVRAEKTEESSARLEARFRGIKSS